MQILDKLGRIAHYICMDILFLLPATILGFLTLKFTTHPHSRIKRKMPRVKVKNVQLFPEITVHIKGKIIRFHHWFNFSVILIISLFITSSLLDAVFTRGFLIGGILQGLSFPDRKIIFDKKELQILNS